MIQLNCLRKELTEITDAESASVIGGAFTPNPINHLIGRPLPFPSHPFPFPGGPIDGPRPHPFPFPGGPFPRPIIPSPTFPRPHLPIAL
jgi:hypothetical protein